MNLFLRKKRIKSESFQRSRTSKHVIVVRKSEVKDKEEKNSRDDELIFCPSIQKRNLFIMWHKLNQSRRNVSHCWEF